MIKEMIMLASYGSFGGGSFGNLLSQLEAAGFFTYILPFLLIFALVFVILTSLPIFKENKGVNAIISLAVALMALQFNVVSIFFSEIFPRLGIALSIILVIVILGSLFVDPDNKGLKWVFVIVTFIIMGIVIFSSLGAFGTGFGNFRSWLQVYGGTLLIVVLVIGGIIAVIASTSPKNKVNIPDINIPLFGQK